MEERENPTTDYYLPALLSSLGLKYERISWRGLEKAKPASYVFLVRYLNNVLIDWLEKNKPKKIFYLMDDDLLDWKVLRFLPYRYAWKIFRKSTIYKDWIRRNAIVLVSNEKLYAKYKEFNSFIIPPNPLWIKEKELQYSTFNSPFVVAYHATASHREEFAWLSKIIHSMQREEVIFEVITDDSSFKYFKNLRNVWTIKQMGWQTYLQFMKLKYRSLALAINYPNPFNLMRSHVKFFNNLYMGLCGIYTDTFPISDLIKRYSAGIILPMKHEEWIATIKRLRSDSKECKEMFLFSVRLYKELKLQALKFYTELANNVL